MKLIFKNAKLIPSIQKHIVMFLLGCYPALSISDIVNLKLFAKFKEA
jgi:hypothetical protein